MDGQRIQRGRLAMTHGLVAGGFLVVFSLLVWLVKVENAGWLRFVNWAILIGAVYFSIKNYRDEQLGGYISYGQSLRYGVLVMFYASIIYALYTVIFLTYIDPESLERAMDAIEETYYERGFSDAEIESAMALAERFRTPFFQALSVILGTTFMGFLISLIVSLVLKNEGSGYDRTMRGIQDAGEVDDTNLKQ